MGTSAYALSPTPETLSTLNPQPSALGNPEAEKRPETRGQEAEKAVGALGHVQVGAEVVRAVLRDSKAVLRSTKAVLSGIKAVLRRY